MSHREKDGDYDRIIFQFGPNDRLIECKDAHQWIFQERKGKEWKSYKFFTSRDGVLCRVREYGLPSADFLFEKLPERFAPVAGRRSPE